MCMLLLKNKLFIFKTANVQQQHVDDLLSRDCDQSGAYIETPTDETFSIDNGLLDITHNDGDVSSTNSHDLNDMCTKALEDLYINVDNITENASVYTHSISDASNNTEQN
ncbi:uncharacterized protein LOC128896623 [Hylaeus anthracinus]|uniref:uncharacterized protein LOC128896623 n=1 Tax=Hylaeus anthracinus TaxID=313031 RepID=UPI0023BA1BAD|nr:uncharacterized protein LOC128896623 [Hylaeus anthracinus]